MKTITLNFNKIKYFSIILFLLSIMTINTIFAQNETCYADILIDLKENGVLDITGPTNVKEFDNIIKSQKFTSKKANIWTLNINSKNESFEIFIFELLMPKNTKITYIKTTPTFRIENQNERIKIIGTGENKPFTLIVQYEIDYNTTHIENNTNNVKKVEKNYILSILIISLLVILLSLVIVFIKHKSKQINNNNIPNDNNRTQEETQQNNKKQKPRYDFNILPKRQQDIILILKEKGKITQKKLEQIMQIPKSSISRNVKTLQVKGIINKECIGQTNYLSLKD